MKGKWNFRISHADRKGFVILLGILLAVVGIYHYILYRERNAPALSATESKELREFEALLRQNDEKNREPEAETFPFDPNSADSLTLLRLGLRPWQVSNALKYRRKGGVWRSAEQFSRLYGLSEEDFKRLKPFIRIRLPEAPKYAEAADTFPRIEKFAEGTTIDLNHCDTTDLKKIPGIGSYYAEKICRYRERLGGFVSLAQIKEIEGLPENVERWFTLSEAQSVKRIPINRATFKELVRHPYLNYEQVKVISQHVHDYGHIGSWLDLKFYKEFSEEDFDRLTPYIAF